MIFCPLASGSSGNCTYVEAGGVRILIDAGLSCKRLCMLLNSINVKPETIDAIFVTHEHADHIAGITVFSKKYSVPVYANAETHRAMMAKKTVVQPGLIRVIAPDRIFYLKKAQILPYSTPHDSVRSMGYSIMQGGCKCTVMTDIGHVSEPMLEAAADSSILLLESNHDVEMLKCGPYSASLKRRILSSRGHLSNADCGAALLKFYRRGIRTVVLGHLSKENNTPELAMVTVKSILQENGILDSMQVICAKRDEPTGIFRIGEETGC